MTKDVGNLRTKLSFEKSGDSNLTDLQRDLKGIRSEMTNFQASSRTYRTSMEGMRKESDILSRRLDVQRERVAELKRRYDESKAATGENSARTKDLATQYNNAQAQAKRTEQQLGRLNDIIRTQESNWTKLGQSVEQHGRQLQKFGSGLTSFGKSYSMRVTTPILGAGLAALKVGTDFEEGMSKVQAVSQASAEDMEKLSDMAKHLAETTKFSATETSEGLYYMGLAGWETQQMLDGLPGILDLAAASGEDLGKVSDIVTDGLSAFNMKAEESGRFADVLAAASANANTDVTGLGNAFQYVAPVAGALGFTIEDTAHAIGLMSDNGVKGQKAGTALRTMMTNLAKPTEAMNKQMEKLGISLTDSEGNMKSFADIMDSMRKSFSGLTEEQQASAAATIFGKEAMSGALAIINTTEQDYRKLAKAIAESEGSAKEMSEIMRDNAKGAMEEFRSALEGAGIAAAEHIIPAVTEITKGATELVRKFGELDESQQKQILKWLGIAAAIGPASIMFGQMATGIGSVMRVSGSLMQVLGRVGGAGLIGRIGALGMTGPVGLAVAGVGTLAGGIYLLTRDSRDLNKVNWDLVESLKANVEETDALINQYEDLELKNRLTTEEMLRYMDILSELQQTTGSDALKALTDEQEELLEKSGLTNEEMDQFLQLNDQIIDKAPETARAISDQGNAYALNADKLKEVNEQERERLMITAERELQKGLENEVALLDEQKDLVSEIKQLTKDLATNQESRKDNTALINEEQQKLVKLEKEALELEQYSTIEGQRKYERKQDEVIEQQKLVDELEHEQNKLDVLYEKMLDKIDKKEEDLDATREEIRQIENLKWDYESLILSQVGITSERGKGLEVLENEIDAIDSARRKLESKTDESLKGTRAFQDQVAELDKQKRRLQDAQVELKNINDLAGRTVYDKQVNIRTNPAISSFNDLLSRPINKSIRLQGHDFYAAYATGTDHHPGGPFLAGEEGWELGRLGNRYEVLNAGFYDRPKGYQVFTHEQSKRIMKSLSNVPKYASGTNMKSETNRIVNRANEPEQPIIIEMHITSEIDGRVAGKAMERYVTDLQNLNEGMRERFA